MIIQLVALLLFITAVIAAVLNSAVKTKNNGSSFSTLLLDFSWWIVNSPAQVAFFMFSYATAIALGTISGAFAQISTQWILSLDILFLISIMLLITFHRLKLYSSTSL